MTKSDFQEMADAVAEAKRYVQYGSSSKMVENASMNALEIVTRELATACARQYKGGYGFNRDKFVTACGFPEA